LKLDQLKNRVNLQIFPDRGQVIAGSCEVGIGTDPGKLGIVQDLACDVLHALQVGSEKIIRLRIVLIEGFPKIFLGTLLQRDAGNDYYDNAAEQDRKHIGQKQLSPHGKPPEVLFYIGQELHKE
jgi:hypothetical protein